MISFHELEPRFVVAIPKTLDPGVLYVSMEYGTVVHSCCCGCGLEVVTPLTPTDWRLSYDGEGISLWPSVGNWSFPCQSHYVITRNRVIESDRWNKERIEAERRRDLAAKQDYYGRPEAMTDLGYTQEIQRLDSNGAKAKCREGLLERLIKRWRRRPSDLE